MKALYALALVAAPLLGMAQGNSNAGTVPADSKPLAEPKPLTAETLWKLGRVSLEAVSPDGSRAVYGVARYDVAANKGERNLFTVDTKSGIASALTETEGAETDAFFLRGGARVGYLYQGQLWTVAVNGTDPKQHTQFPDGVSNLKVQEMKDGRLLVVFTVVQKLNKAPNEVHPEFPKADYKAYNDLL